MNASVTYAVKISSAEKCYENKSGVKPTFTGLNLNLPLGQIYALLGPSGCGKTTLLRCILGRLKLDKGTVMVFGHPPGSKESGIPGPNVGYMTQETTVYLMMTIGEYLWYYGTIFGLSSSQISSRTEYFIKLLRLPSKNMLANTLSGGELRRIQFAAALIHQPKLIILDEPTVGIEVTTKQMMWEYLVTLTKENGSTVLMTTHYIEEARLADRVGMIHNCTMAAEDSAANLLRNYNEATLEGVFLKICYGEIFDVVVDNGGRTNVQDELLTQQAESKTTGQEMQAVEAGGKSSFAEKSRKIFSERECNIGVDVTWHRLWPIIRKTIITLYRSPVGLVTVLLLPSIQGFLFMQALGKPSGLPMIIVNEDLGQIGAQYLTYIDTDIVRQKHYRDYDVGLQAVRQGDFYGILHIKPNFSSTFYRRYTDFDPVNNQLLDAGTVHLQMDNINANVAKLIELHMLESYQHFLHDTVRSIGINPMLVKSPINVSEEVAQLLGRPPCVYMMSAFMGNVSFFGAITLVLITCFVERQGGFMEPNFIAGVTPLEIILGILIVEVVLIGIRIVGVMLIALPLLNQFNKGSILLIYSLLYVQGLNGVALGIFISLLSNQTFLMTGYVAFYLSGSSATGGVFWPIEAMPLYFRHFCQWLPMTQCGRAIEVIIHRGWDLRHFAVYSAFGISFFWIFVFIAISLWIFSHKK